MASKQALGLTAAYGLAEANALSEALSGMGGLAATLAERAEARANKNWAESDRLRDLIISMGYTLKDTKQGQQISKAI